MKSVLEVQTQEDYSFYSTFKFQQQSNECQQVLYQVLSTEIFHKAADFLF